ncbi:MAG: metallophosphoesterase, partial [Syntrophomonadaceae bacterium]|nr:metallophosphoesterase [Syntrophomonadaceae bacterium]
MPFVFWLLVGLAVLAIGWYLYLERYTIQVKRYVIHLKNLPRGFEGFTILQLSDLHSKQFGQNQENLIRVINQQKYDMVALTGDFINKFKPDFEPAMDLIDQLSNVPIYFVPGNHEWKTGFKAK